MELSMDFAKPLAGDVRIKFRGADGGVAQQFLNHPQIRTVFEQVGGEAVAQHVGRDVPRHPGAADAPFDMRPESVGGERGAAVREEDIGGGARLYEFGARSGQVTIQSGRRLAAHGHHAFLVPLADDVDEARLQLELLQPNRPQLRDTDVAVLVALKIATEKLQLEDEYK